MEEPIESTETLEAIVPVPSPLEQEIETWFQDIRRNLYYLDTEVHNCLYEAKEDLKQRLQRLR